MTMEEIIAKGKVIYERHLRPRLATPENTGKLLRIDVDSGDYELGEDGNDVELFRALRSRHPHAQVFSLKVGYRTADAVGTSLQLEWCALSHRGLNTSKETKEYG